MNVIRTKICGITRIEDAVAAAEAGADAIGLVFYPPSPRFVESDVARKIVRAVGPFVTPVALFVNPQKSLVDSVLATVAPHVLQFHGDEPAAFCEQFHRPYLKAVRVRAETDIAAVVAEFPGASGFIFDAWSDDLYGGTGKTFNWNKLSGFGGAPAILAGGLNPGNVAKAIGITRPYGVDVSGGVESAPGIKDREKIFAFTAAAKRARSQFEEG